MTMHFHSPTFSYFASYTTFNIYKTLSIKNILAKYSLRKSTLLALLAA